MSYKILSGIFVVAFVLLFVNFLTNGSLFQALSTTIDSQRTSQTSMSYPDAGSSFRTTQALDVSDWSTYQKAGALLVLLAAGVLVLMWFWLTLHAFSDEVTWGIGSLLFPPAAFFFGLLFIENHRVAVLVSLYGFFLLIAGVLLVAFG